MTKIDVLSPLELAGGQNVHITERTNSKHSGTILFVSSLNPIKMEEASSPDAISLYVRTGH